MYVYNITTNIQENAEKEWLAWMQNTHIPEMLDTGKFLSAKMCKVLVEEDLGGMTYSVQYTVENRDILEDFHRTDAVTYEKQNQCKICRSICLF